VNADKPSSLRIVCRMQWSTIDFKFDKSITVTFRFWAAQWRMSMIFKKCSYILLRYLFLGRPSLKSAHIIVHCNVTFVVFFLRTSFVLVSTIFYRYMYHRHLHYIKLVSWKLKYIFVKKRYFRSSSINYKNFVDMWDVLFYAYT